MNGITDEQIASYVQTNIGSFHEKRIEALNRLELNKLLRRNGRDRLEQACGFQFGQRQSATSKIYPITESSRFVRSRPPYLRTLACPSVSIIGMAIRTLNAISAKGSR